jgi:opacity protein-like surface antigen
MNNTCKKGLLVLYMLCSVSALQAQKIKSINQFVDFTGTVGKSQGTAAIAYVYNKRFGKNKKIEAGVGLRWTFYSGSKTNFTTAPARLARTTTVPFIIVFAGQKYENIDTLTVQRPLINSVNISINLGYNFSTRWNAGFNIDLIGFTSGRRTSAILTGNGITKNESMAKPTAFNVLLTGDNDYGSLNSEYFVKYKIDNRWGLKAVYQFLFVEYKTENIKQTAPDGTIVDRFRNKANNFGLGISYNF